MGNPVEDFLNEVENKPLWEDTEDWADRVMKLLNLVRLYRRGIDVFTKFERITLEGIELTIKYEGSKSITTIIGEKALEIIK